MTTTELIQSVAFRTGLSVGLVFDVDADPRECWLCTIGLDASGTGAYPSAAVGRALLDLEGYQPPDPMAFLFGQPESIAQSAG